MRPSFECLRCLVNVRLREVESSNASREVKLGVARRLLNILESEFDYNAEITHLATKLYNTVVGALPDVADYYRGVKRELNRLALENLASHVEYAGRMSGLSRFRYLVKLSALGNLIDLGVAGHNPITPLDLKPGVVESHGFCLDYTEDFHRLVSRGGLRVLWLFDNAGEAVYDTLLISELRRLGNTVWGLVKDEPGFQNDITLDDALYIGLDKVLDRVLTYGCKCSTIHMEGVGGEARMAVREADVIVSKGMSHYEYLSELNLGKPVVFILIPKCTPIASSIGDPGCRGKIVVMVR
jgi:hypothetical protein